MAHSPALFSGRGLFF
uniref:Uncharacterized protein n=1 Tax=Rhizophora mucronata TaxID=61149 RepID=A0A2P2IZM2_RHIMU